MNSTDPSYKLALSVALRAIPAFNRTWAGGPALSKTVEPAASAWTSGVIATVCATFDGLAGRSSGKVYHHYPPGSVQEFHWARGCQFASEKLMSGAIFHNAVRGGE